MVQRRDIAPADLGDLKASQRRQHMAIQEHPITRDARRLLLWPRVLTHVELRERLHRLALPSRALLREWVAADSNRSKQFSRAPACILACQGAMFPDRHARRTRAPPVLEHVGPHAELCDPNAKARQLFIPNEQVASLLRNQGLYRALGEPLLHRIPRTTRVLHVSTT